MEQVISGNAMSVDCPQRHVHRRWDTNTTTRSPEDQCSDSIAAPEQERGDAFFFHPHKRPRRIGVKTLWDELASSQKRPSHYRPRNQHF